MLWSFYEFVLGGIQPRGIVSDGLDVGARAELDVILSEHLGIKPHHDWKMPDYKPLGGGLGEIRFEVSKLAYRVFGSFAPGMTFRMWVVATKNRKRKGKQATDPPNAIEKARNRKQDYDLRGVGVLRRYDP